MKTDALICDANHHLLYDQVELAPLDPTHMLVRNLVSGVSFGTERLLIEGKVSWGPYPLCLGYQAIGIVEDPGKQKHFKAGDTVYYRFNHQGKTTWNKTTVSMTTGTHARHAVVDTACMDQSYDPQVGDHGPALLPSGIDHEAASLFVMPAVGLNGIRMAEVKPSDWVAVVGCGLIGLGVVALATLRGAKVIAIDIEDHRLDVAKKLGAHAVINTTTNDLAQSFASYCPDGADVVFEASGIPACITIALPLCKVHGKFVFQGNYGQGMVPFDFLSAHARHLRAFFPCDDGYRECRQAVLNLMASGHLPWQHVITHRLEPTQAADFYNEFIAGQHRDALGAVIRWSQP